MSEATRLIDGVEVPVAGTWTIDPSHTTVEFVGRHLMFTKVRGRFEGVSGSITIGDAPNDSSVEVTLDVTSVSTGAADRDAHLKSGDFFDVDSYPVITFKSTNVEWKGTEGTIAGDLTVRGVTKPVTLEGEFHGVITDPWGGTRAAFTAKTEVNREDWDLKWNVALEAGGVLVSKNIQLEIETELVLQS